MTAGAGDWKNIGPLANVPLRGARRLCLKSAGKPIAVFHAADGAVFALIDECPHKKGPLSEGIVAGRTVTCPLHNWVIQLEDGSAAPPDVGSVRPLPVRVVNGDIHIHVPEPEPV